MSSSGNATVVRLGVWSRSVGMSSKPAMPTSPGTDNPISRHAAIAPIAITSVTANTQTGARPVPAVICRAAANRSAAA